MQIYLSSPEDAEEPIRRLVGFRRITLDPGAQTTVTIAEQSLRIWQPDIGWHIPHGTHRAWLGRNAENVIEIGNWTTPLKQTPAQRR